MSTKSKRQKGREGALSSLNVAIDALILTNKASTIAPVKAAFDSANVLLTTIRVGSLPLHVGRLLANVYRTQRPTNQATSNWG